MKAYLTLIKIDIQLAFRQRVVIFFNYLMPLAFFFVFAQAFHANQGGLILQVVAMVTVIGILGNGLFGAGIRAAQEREQNILRRYKVAPITPLPLLVASSVTGLVVYLPFFVLMLAVAKGYYGMTMPRHMDAVLIFVVLGICAIRSIGLIVASVANSMQESGILVQIIYMAMLFLSGTTFPTSMFPNWLLTTVQFIPATWLMTGIQGMMLRNETLAANWEAVGAMLVTTAVGLFLSVKLFRWEKEEKMRPAAKLWLVVVLVPFAVLGTWQARTKDNVSKMKIVGRDLARSRTVLLRNARIFVGNGKVIENGGVLVKAGKIAEVYDGNIPDPKSVKADPVEAAGKTILPGLIDTDVHLSQPGGFYGDAKNDDVAKMMQRNLAAYLYCGVTAVRSAGDPPDQAINVRKLVNSGEKQGAELFLTASQSTDAAQPLSVGEAMREFAEGKPDLLNRSLVQQVSPPALLEGTRNALKSHALTPTPVNLDIAKLGIAKDNLLSAYRHGVVLVMGSGAGSALVFHGPSVQHELQLWVDAGIPIQVALQAATLNAAKALRADQRLGSIEKGKDATMLVVDGNPLQDIKATEAISFVMFKGENVDRPQLFK